jgi:hypothetical protein
MFMNDRMKKARRVVSASQKACPAFGAVLEVFMGLAELLTHQ